MHQELIRELAVISEEEQRILDGQKGIDQHIYMEIQWSCRRETSFFEPECCSGDPACRAG